MSSANRKRKPRTEYRSRAERDSLPKAALFGFHHRGIHVYLDEGQLGWDPSRKAPFHILSLRLPTRANECRDYLDGILDRLEPPPAEI